MAYKVRKTKTGRGYDYCTIHVPNEVARLIPDGERFEPVLTEDGLLYRRVDSPAPAEAPPSWAHKAA